MILSIFSTFITWICSKVKHVPNAGETNLVAVAGDCKDNSFLRKVDVFNEDYRLKEKGAILNWFDVTAPEGYFSLNDKVSDIVESKEGAKVFTEFMAPLSANMMGASSVGEGKQEGSGLDKMLKMLGSFTVLR